jgi:hypothetical protein
MQENKSSLHCRSCFVIQSNLRKVQNVLTMTECSFLLLLHFRSRLSLDFLMSMYKVPSVLHCRVAE